MSDIQDLSGRWAKPVTLYGTRVRNYPIDRDPNHFTVSEEVIYSRRMWAPTPRGTAHPEFPTAVLVSETPIEEQQDFIRLSRVYSTVPSTTSEPISIAYQYLGYADVSLGGVGTLREPRTYTVLGRQKKEYFLNSDPFGDLVPTNKIQILQAFRAVVIYSGSTIPYDTDYITDGAGGGLVTIPSISIYYSWINDKTELIARDSELSQYLGDIWCRTTTYVTAQ